MHKTNGSDRAERLRRNPLYRKMQANRWRAKQTAEDAGYASVSAFYKALRFERMPEGERLSRIAKLIGLSEGKTWELWRKEMARS